MNYKYLGKILGKIMILEGMTFTELGRRLGLHYVGVITRVGSKKGQLIPILQILETLGYEIVVRPMTKGNLPEGEYALRFKDYPNIPQKRDEVL